MPSSIWHRVCTHVFVFKGSGHYWQLLKILIGIKPYLVTSNEKQLPLKCQNFRERRTFPRIWFRDLRFRTWGLEINHQNAHNFVWQGCFFLSLLSRKFDDRSSSNFHRFVILCLCWETPTVKASLWQLPIVSSAYKVHILIQILCTFIQVWLQP